MERYNISNKEEFEKVCQYLKDTLPFLKEFAKSINANVRYTTGYDWPTIKIYYKRKFVRENGYNIDKSIFITISDYKYPPIYNIWTGVSNNYGLKEIFEIIYCLFNKEKYFYKRLSWKKDIGCVDPPIDKEKLKSLLIQAKQILDNFDESQLQEVK